MPSSEGPVTVVLTRSILPGREADHERWVAETTTAMRAFPGFLGAALNRPTNLNPKWVFMPRWDSAEHLLAWDASPELEARVQALLPLVEGDTDRQRHEGLDIWLAPPDTPRPARWKMMLVTFLVLWPTILALMAALAMVPALAALPWWAGPLPMLLLMVPLLEFVLMPLATRVFARFLYG